MGCFIILLHLLNFFNFNHQFDTLNHGLREYGIQYPHEFESQAYDGTGQGLCWARLFLKYNNQGDG
jgi:hypothetical protein